MRGLEVSVIAELYVPVRIADETICRLLGIRALHKVQTCIDLTVTAVGQSGRRIVGVSCSVGKGSLLLIIVWNASS